MNYTVNKEMTATKIKATAKAQLIADFTEFLIEKYGEEDVAMVRTGSSSQVNEIGAIIGTVEDDGRVYPVCITVNPTVKDWKDRVGTKKTFAAFDFEEAKSEYKFYVNEKAESEAEKATAKAAKIARDKKARADKAKETETE